MVGTINVPTEGTGKTKTTGDTMGTINVFNCTPTEKEHMTSTTIHRDGNRNNAASAAPQTCKHANLKPR